MAEARPGAGDAATITMDVAARLLRVTPRRLQQLVSDGWITRTGHGRYSVVGVVHGYLAYRDDLEQRRAASTQQESLRDARQREIEQRMAVRDHRLVDLEEVHAIFDEVAGHFRAELVGLPARVTRDRKQRRRIETEVDGALNRFADRFAQAAGDLGATGAAPAPAAEDDA